MALSTRLQDRNVDGGYLKPVIVTEILEGVTIAGDVEVIQPIHDDLNANANIQVADTDVSATNPVPMDDTWQIGHWGDISADDSDKRIAVTAGEIFHILWVWVELTSTAAAGDRQIIVELQDDTNDVIGQFRAGAVQAASLTYYYMFAPALADLTAVRDVNYLMTPFPPTVILPAGYQLRVYDSKAIAAAADDMVVMMLYAHKAA